MASADEMIIREEDDGSLSFGNHSLGEKAKKEDFQHDGGIYKVKTYSKMTKLEKNGALAYESVPGTSVTHFKENALGVDFMVEGAEDAQLTVGVEEGAEYEVMVAGESIGKMKSSMGGKLIVSVELEGAGKVPVVMTKK